MTVDSTFEQLLEEGNCEPVDGWDFSWFNGRASEARPSWGYFEQLGERIRTANAVLDVQTGGGERFAEILSTLHRLPETLAATESWPPNLAIARTALRSFGVAVREVADDANFPFDEATFDLVCSRHPTVNVWPEIHRVLQPGGTYFSQQVGAGTNSELSDFIMGPQPISPVRDMGRTISLATAAGLEVINAQQESLPVVFFDVGAVVYFLRKVLWTVPDFSVERYRGRLQLLHQHIREHGEFTSHSLRFLFEAKKSG